ncbi:hypothetical protein [Brevundimonas sp. Leaf363]|uniref:hypothetical protein n=1 Tax=Brevundimonas sp. Leaf363 TaxID=1736353 RepID=UPI000AA33D02|nr:hypothetical protein [Brevundimonas sp. Leaf363]
MSEADSLDKYAALVELLFEKSDTDQIKWSESIMGGFEAPLAGKILAISKIDKPTGSAPDYEIRILRSNDYQLIDSFRDVTLSDYGVPPFGPFTTYYQSMKYIYEKIARRLSGADQALSDILAELSRTKDS